MGCGGSKDVKEFMEAANARAAAAEARAKDAEAKLSAYKTASIADMERHNEKMTAAGAAIARWEQVKHVVTVTNFNGGAESAILAGADAKAEAEGVVDETEGDTWSMSSWAEGLGVHRAVARALRRPLGHNLLGRDGSAQLSFVRALSSRAEVAALLAGPHGEELLSEIVDVLWAGVEKLQSGEADATPSVADKFLQSAEGMLNYGDLNTFFSGLEGKIGPPNPKVREAMEAEHSQRADSRLEFTTGNYEVTTTSAIEWLFVAKPDERAQWPVEAQLLAALEEAAQGMAAGRPRSKTAEAMLRANAKPRSPMPLAKLQDLVNARNAKLAALGEPSLTLDEGLGGRLYTGPMFIKYAPPKSQSPA